MEAALIEFFVSVDKNNNSYVTQGRGSIMKELLSIVISYT